MGREGRGIERAGLGEVGGWGGHFCCEGGVCLGVWGVLRLVLR